MKYIVYKTTNLINNFIYIGVHKTLTPEIFDGYLGCGAYIKRPSSYNQGKTRLHQAIVQYGVQNFKRETLGVYNNIEDAYLAESLLVNKKFLERPDVYNMVLGGKINWTSGRKVFIYSATTGKYITEFDSIMDASEYANCDPSTISHSISFKFKVNNFIFKYEKYNNIDLKEYNFKVKFIVYRYLKSGEFDKKYNSLNQAGVSTNCSARQIQQSAEFGYLVKDMYYFSFYKFNSYEEARAYQILKRKVYKYNQYGEFIEEYESQKDAEIKNPNCNITNCVKLRIPDINGNYWTIIKVNHYNKPVHRKAKKVGEFNDNGILLRTWESSNKCAKDVGIGVKQVLRGNFKRHKGLIYKYID